LREKKALEYKVEKKRSKKLTRRDLEKIAYCLANLIGRKIKVLLHTDPSLKGISGVVVFETKHSLVLKAYNRTIRILKRNTVLEVNCGYYKITVPGDQVVGSIPEKIKKFSRKLKL